MVKVVDFENKPVVYASEVVSAEATGVGITIVLGRSEGRIAAMAPRADQIENVVVVAGTLVLTPSAASKLLEGLESFAANARKAKGVVNN